jgi:NADH dehydrogenase
LYLVEFENRLLVLIQWAWSYVTWDRGARLITGEDILPVLGGAAPECMQDVASEAGAAGVRAVEPPRAARRSG